MRVRELRLARGWSQAELAERSGLSIRTIQRIETGASPGLESLRNLAAVLGVEVADLHDDVSDPTREMTFGEAVTHCLRHYADFTGVAGRTEFWWFTLAVALALSAAAAVGPWLSTAVAAALLLPLLAAATRRLRSAGQSPWWLLMLPVPVGGLVVLGWLLAMPDVTAESRETATAGLRTS